MMNIAQLEPYYQYYNYYKKNKIEMMIQFKNILFLLADVFHVFFFVCIFERFIVCVLECFSVVIAIM